MKKTAFTPVQKLGVAAVSVVGGLILLGSSFGISDSDGIVDSSNSSYGESLSSKVDALFNSDNSKSSDISIYEPENSVDDRSDTSKAETFELSDFESSPDAVVSTQTTSTMPSVSQTASTTQSTTKTASTTPSAPQTLSTTPSATQNKSNVVYIASSGNGKKYHRTKTCSKMKGTISMTVEEAKAAGYTPCQKKSCYG